MKPSIPNAINREKLEVYVPEALSVAAIAGAIVSLVYNHRTVALRDAYMRIAEPDRYKLTVIQRTHSNNWLKMHGYPMRRRYRK